MKKITNFIFESGILNNIQRSGAVYLGTGKQTIAEHSFRTSLLGHLLTSFYPKVDKNKVTLMCLYHDLHESRTGDLNPIQKKHCIANEEMAIVGVLNNHPLKKEITELLKEYEKKSSLESKIAKDADILEWISFLAEQKWNGNKKAKYWISLSLPCLKTKAAKNIAQDLIKANPDDWWKELMVQSPRN